MSLDPKSTFRERRKKKAAENGATLVTRQYLTTSTQMSHRSVHSQKAKAQRLAQRASGKQQFGFPFIDSPFASAVKSCSIHELILV